MDQSVKVESFVCFSVSTGTRQTATLEEDCTVFPRTCGPGAARPRSHLMERVHGNRQGRAGSSMLVKEYNGYGRSW